MKPDSKTIKKTKNRFLNIVLHFIIYSILFAVNSYGQSITWQRLYDVPGGNVSYCYTACLGDSGNFYSGGHAFITNLSDYRMCVFKLNPYGDTIWIRIIDTLGTRIRAMTSTEDGGCVVVGDDNFSIKLSSNGAIVWTKYYNTQGVELYDIIKTMDGGYIACGSLYNVNNNTYNGYLIKLDINGNMQWQQIYISNDIKDLNSIIQSQGGNYAIAGTNSDFFGDTLKMLFLKVDPSGSIITDKRYTVFGQGGAGIRINHINDQFVIGGITRDPINLKLNACFIRIDTSGNLIFTKKYEANRHEVFYDMKIIGINKYIFTRQRDLIGANQVDSYVMVIDSVGNTLKEKVFSLAEVVSFWSILIMQNGDFVFAGAGRNVLPSPYRTFLVRTDSNLYAPPIGINNTISTLPDSYILKQNYPNPFNSSTIIEFEMKNRASVEINLFDILGRIVVNLLDNNLNSGTYKIRFNANDYPSGIYFYQMRINGLPFTTKKMILLK